MKIAPYRLVTFASLAVIAASQAQTVLPPDPSKTIGEPVSLEGFVDEHERPVTALTAASTERTPRVWIISPIYTRCPLTCSPITTSLKAALHDSGLGSADYRVVSLSFDRRETGESLQSFRDSVHLPDEWLTVRATAPAALERTLRSLDFRTMTIGDGQYAHPNLLAVLTPDMRLNEYIFGVTFSPSQLAAAVRAARTGDPSSRSWYGKLVVVSGVGLLVSAGIFGALLGRRRSRG